MAHPHILDVRLVPPGIPHACRTCADQKRASGRLQLTELALAYRRGALRLHATDPEHFACVKVDTSDEEVANMAAMLNAAKHDPTSAAVMIPKPVYKALRKSKAPFCLERVGEAWFLKEYGGALHPVRVEAVPRQVEFLERILDEEKDRAELGAIRFKPTHALECLAALHPDLDVDGMPALEVPLDERKPIIVRKDDNVAVFMPIRCDEERPIDKAIALCKESVVSGNAASGLAAEVLRLLKVPLPASVESENVAPTGQ